MEVISLYQELVQKVVKKITSNMKLYKSTELLVDWTSREFQNQTISFSKKITPSI